MVADESSGNWYSDPDEDRANDEAYPIYQSNSNRNSVLECVNQILLRDMEDEESTLSLSRRYKHKGKVVCFQAAKLSDIESVGSEVERKNSEEQPEAGKPLRTFEDEFGERKVQGAKALVIIEGRDKPEDVSSDVSRSPKVRYRLVGGFCEIVLRFWVLGCSMGCYLILFWRVGRSGRLSFMGLQPWDNLQ